MLKLSLKSVMALTVLALFQTTQLRAADIVDTAVGAGNFKTLVTAVKAADLVETLKGEGPFTVLAPTDEAFAAVPEEVLADLLKPANKSKLQSVLLYHVVAGKVGSDAVVNLTGAETVNGQRIDIKVEDGTVMIDGAKVVATDIQCDNGVIHVIDSVILPESKTLPEVADAAGSFSTLIAAAKAAGLVPALSGEDNLTVFAPTDAAFAALPEGTVASLLKPENKGQLASILKYHVVPGRVYSDKALEAGSAKTLQGGSVQIAVDGDTAMVNDAKLLSTDIDASNGVIHVIDKVLIPPTDSQSSTSPKQAIEHAIAQGSQLYNDGHAEACASLYHETMKTVLTTDHDGLSAHTVSQMDSVLQQAESTSCANSRAWMLRKGLEVAYSDLNQ